MRIDVELNCDQIDDIVYRALFEMLDNEGNPKIRKALHKVIAYNSIPGHYLNGKYDLESYVNEGKYETST